jgi:hypothetical protein
MPNTQARRDGRALSHTHHSPGQDGARRRGLRHRPLGRLAA